MDCYLLRLTMVSGLGSIAGLTYFNLLSLNGSLENLLQQKSTGFMDEIKHFETQSILAAKDPDIILRLKNKSSSTPPLLPSMAQFSGLKLLDPSGKQILNEGIFMNQSLLSLPIHSQNNAILFWHNGFWVQNKLPVYDINTHAYLGELVTEASLSKFNLMYTNYQGFGETGEVVICGRHDKTADCFPTRFRPNAFQLPLRFDKVLPIDSALKGEKGSTNARGYHQHDVIAAYTPLNQLGLGMVVQITTAEVYKPLQNQLKIILPVALFLIFCGLLLLYWQVVPLVRKVVFSEKKLEKTNSELANSVEQLNQRNQEMALLQELSAELQSCVNIEDAYQIIVHYAKRLLKPFSGTLFLIDDSRTHLKSCSSFGNPKFQANLLKPDDCLAIRHGNARSCMDPKSDLVCNHERLLAPDIPAYACIPLLAQGEVFGLLYLEWITTPKEDDFKLLAMSFTEQLALALANIRLREHLRAQSLHDPLTGVYNRRYLHEAMEIEFGRVDRKSSTLAVLMIDIDHFKTFNDQFGHDAGDEVLKMVASKLAKQIRPQDYICRYGGEEFIIIMSEIDLKVTLERAQQLVLEVSKMHLVHNGQALGNVTISVGVAMYPKDGKNVDDIVSAADKALYQAKATGRNKVIVSNGHPF